MSPVVARFFLVGDIVPIETDSQLGTAGADQLLKEDKLAEVPYVTCVFVLQWAYF